MSVPLSIQLIDDAYRKKSTFLDLGNCNLREIPEEIIKLRDFLQHLNLGGWYYVGNERLICSNNLPGNFFHDTADSFNLLSNFKSLLSLDAIFAGIRENGAKYISSISTLTSLNLEGNFVNDEGAKCISDLKSLTSLNLNSNGLGDNGVAYISELESLTTLSLDFNKIGEKGAWYISKCPLLSYLNLDHNDIGERGAAYIGELSFLTSLRLENNNIGAWGAEFISGLSLLTSLRLGSNNIGEKGTEHISKLSSLTSLSLQNNDIREDGAAYISQLSSLTSLHLFENKIGEKGAEYVSSILSLNSLSLDNNNIGKKGAEYISKLPSLSSLFASNNKIGDKGAEYISELSSLITLGLDKNNIGQKGIEYISKLSSLSYLSLDDNDVGEKGAQYISELSSLSYLSLNNNGVGNEGAAYISKLAYLTNLELEHNKISRFNSIASNSINTLNLQHNLLETISLDLVRKIKIEIELEEKESFQSGKIFLHGNPISVPPPEVINKGRDAILEYLEGDLRPLNECKLIFVGDGGVGKTSLMKRLVYNEFTKGEKTTHGINKIAWKGLKNKNGEPINVNLWDFGGQHIQHSLHQFFFTERVVYVLVLNPRNDGKAGYWLDQIDKLGRNSQIIIVYNWKDEEDKQADFLGNFRELRKTYKYLPEPIILSCAADNEISDFEELVKSAVLANEGLKTKYPENWFNIKQKLETGIPIEKHYVKYEDYEIWCAEEKYYDPIRRRNLLRILDSVGSIVFFDKPVLNELQILNPEWISTGAYAIITSELTRENKGHLTWDDLRSIFSVEKEIFSDKHIKIKYQEAQFKFILQLMLDYRLCQKNPLVEHEYLIPGAFGEKPKKTYDVAGGRHFRLTFQSQFEMLIVHQFIAKNILHIVSNDYWNSGIFFKHTSSDTYALVETNQYSRVIDCWIKGDNIRGMWEVIRNDFRDIFSMYNNFPVDEEVEYTVGEITVFLKYEEMLAALRNGVSTIHYDPKTGLKNIDVLHVLGLFESPEQTNRNMINEQIKVEVNPQITINPQIINNPVINNKQIDGEAKEKKIKKKAMYDTTKEILMVKKWKNEAITIFVLGIPLTIISIFFYVKEWILAADTWNLVEQYPVITAILVFILELAWNGFIVKIFYDRLFDPTKEKAYRESLRNSYVFEK